MMRRHKTREHLYVMELHPGGGQGDTLALYRRRPGSGQEQKLDDFRGWRRLGEASDPAGPTVRCFRLMADVLGLALNSRQSLQWRSAWHDSSGMDGCSVRQEFLSFRDRVGSTLTERSGWPDDAAELLRWWMLTGGTESGDWRVHAVVDLHGRVWAGPGLRLEAGVPDLVSQRGSQLGAALDVWLATGLR